MKPHKRIPVLDKGFVRLVDAARVSHASASKGPAADKKLIGYLLAHSHLTPFEHAVFKFHVACPIFVARQWFRHRFAAYNELSYRYTEAKDEFYVPSAWRAQDGANKQGSVAATALDQEKLTGILAKQVASALAAYRGLIASGVAREMARMVLPVNLYTQFYWTVNARSLMNFVALRADRNAQWEMRRYAEALASVFAKAMPQTWEAFLKHAWKGDNAAIQAGGPRR